MQGKEWTLLSLGSCTVPKFVNVGTLALFLERIGLSVIGICVPVVRETAAIRLAHSYLKKELPLNENS